MHNSLLQPDRMHLLAVIATRTPNNTLHTAVLVHNKSLLYLYPLRLRIAPPLTCCAIAHGCRGPSCYRILSQTMHIVINPRLLRFETARAFPSVDTKKSISRNSLHTLLFARHTHPSQSASPPAPTASVSQILNPELMAHDAQHLRLMACGVRRDAHGDPIRQRQRCSAPTCLPHAHTPDRPPARTHAPAYDVHTHTHHSMPHLPM